MTQMELLSTLQTVQIDLGAASVDWMSAVRGANEIEKIGFHPGAEIGMKAGIANAREDIEVALRLVREVMKKL